ncbi:MAG: hypothetical protein V4594_01665 [Bacteroidota bacterium]
MKKLVFIILVAIAALSSNKVAAQVSVNVNIGSQPLWGPTGYDHVDYYYLPEIESYYYVPDNQFIYLTNGNWVRSNGVSPRYVGYNLYRGYKVVINSPEPYRYFSTHKLKYAKYKTVHTQPAIKYSKNTKYYVVKGHPGNSGKAHFKNASYSPKSNGKAGGKAHGGGNGKGKGHGKH